MQITDYHNNHSSYDLDSTFTDVAFVDLLKYETELKYDASEVKGSSVIADHMHKQLWSEGTIYVTIIECNADLGWNKMS